MLEEAQKTEVEDCIKLQSLITTTQVPKLMMSFDSQINQQKENSEVNLRRPKMKFRDAHEVLEIARLKVLVSELREKGIQLEAQLSASCAADDGNIVHMKSHDDQKDNNKREVMEKQVAKLDGHIKHLHVQINTLQCDVDKMLLEISGKDGLQKELTMAKAKIKGLQEEMRNDAGLTKTQLILLQQHFGELEEIQVANTQKELEFHKALEVSSEMEAEVAELRQGNQDLLHQKEQLSKKLLDVQKTVEKMSSITEDDVVAAEAEISELRAANSELKKEVESLQISRFNEVEELVYLRWVNACLLHNLDTHKDSHRNSEHTSVYSNKNSPTSHGNDEGNPTSLANVNVYPTSHGNGATSHSNVYGDPTSHANVYRIPTPRAHGYPTADCYDKGIPTAYYHDSKGSPTAYYHDSKGSATAYYHDSKGSHGMTISHGNDKGSQTSHQKPHQGAIVLKSHPRIVAPHITSHDFLSHSPSYHGYNDTYDAWQYGPGQLAMQGSPQRISERHSMQSSPQRMSERHSMQNNPQMISERHSMQSSPQRISERHSMQSSPQRISERHSMRSFSNISEKSEASSYMTTITSSPLNRSRKSFIRSSSNVSLSSEASISHMQSSSPKNKDIRRFMRSSSNLSSESEFSRTSYNINDKPLQRHSASSGMSLLDAYLESTDTKGLNKPTSRLFSPLPYDRWSDSGVSPIGIIKEGVEFPRKHDPSNVRAHSLERKGDAPDGVASAFQLLSASRHASNTHPAFKDLSRQNSHIDEGSIKAGQHMVERYQSSNDASADVNSSENDVGDMLSRESQNSQSDAISIQADFVRDLARAIQATDYRYIEDVTAFINWFDRQAEQDFLNYSDWPKKKVDAMRRAVYEYEDLKILESDISSFKDEPKSPTDLVLKEMLALQEKAEKRIHGFTQARDLAIAQFEKFNIPTYWMLDCGMIGKIKQASLHLAQKYMERVTKDLNMVGEFQTNEVSRDLMLVQAASFLVQVHHFAGGFDENTLKAFKELKNKDDFHQTSIQPPSKDVMPHVVPVSTYGKN